MSTESLTPAKPRRRLLIAFLIASLALNAALGGFFAVQTWRRFDMAGPPSPRGFLKFVRWKLPAADRPVLDMAIDKREAELATAQVEAQQAMSAAFATLRRPDFNETEFRAAVAKAREKRLRVADLGLEVLIDAVGHISPDGRAALIPKMRRWEERK